MLGLDIYVVCYFEVVVVVSLSCFWIGEIEEEWFIDWCIFFVEQGDVGNVEFFVVVLIQFDGLRFFVDCSVFDDVFQFYFELIVVGVGVVVVNKKGFVDCLEKSVVFFVVDGIFFEVIVGVGLFVLLMFQDFVIIGDQVGVIDGVFLGMLVFVFDWFLVGVMFFVVVCEVYQVGYIEFDFCEDFLGQDVV